MNRALKIVTATLFACLVLTEVSLADSLDMEDSPEIEQTLKNFRGNDFDIEYIHNWHHLTDRADGPESVPERSPSAIEHIQEAISSNPELARTLRARGVDIRTIVNADEAADGGVTFYIR